MNEFLSRILGNGPRGPSLTRLLDEMPGLARHFLWGRNGLPQKLPDPLWLHVGCGENVIEGFANLDFLPLDGRVGAWDLLDEWPASWPSPAAGALSEDTLEHFFLAEQLYILCEMNRALAPAGVFRVLMPSFARLLAYCQGFAPKPGEFLHSTFGVETEADAINMGLRFSGHRWLHDDRSLAHLAALAGFEAVKTTCADSTVPFLSNRNLRSEADSAAFAHDLVKRRGISRVVIEPAELHGIEILERPADHIAFARVREAGASISYRLPRSLPVEAIACVNVRGANLSSFREHSLKRLNFRGGGSEGAWALDETLKSKPAMNLALPSALRLACAGRLAAFDEVALQPGAAGDLLTVGAAEVFHFPVG